MKRACPFRRTGLAAAVGSAALLAAGHAGLAYGSAFALQEQSGSGLGNADDQVYMPITTVMARLFAQRVVTPRMAPVPGTHVAKE